MSITDYFPRGFAKAATIITTAATTITSLSGCVTYSAGPNQLSDRGRLKPAVAEVYEQGNPAVQSEAEQAPEGDVVEVQNVMSPAKMAELEAVEIAKTEALEADIATTMKELRKPNGNSCVPNSGDPRIVMGGIPKTYDKQDLDGIVMRPDFNNRSNTGIGSREQSIHELTKYVKDLFDTTKPLNVAEMTFSDPKVTGGFNKILVCYQGDQEMGLGVYAKMVETVEVLPALKDKELPFRAKDMPSFNVVLKPGEESKYTLHVQPWRKIADMLIDIGLSAFQTSKLYGQWQVGAAGKAANIATTEFLNLFRYDDRIGDVDFIPHYYSEPDAKYLTPQQKFWSAFGQDGVAEGYWMIPFKNGGNSALVVLESDRDEITRNPLNVNIAILGDEEAKVESYAYLGDNVAIDYLIAAGANLVEREARQAAYDTPEQETKILPILIPLVIPYALPPQIEINHIYHIIEVIRYIPMFNDVPIIGGGDDIGNGVDPGDTGDSDLGGGDDIGGGVQ